MIYDCISCGAPLLRARAIDNVILVLDQQPDAGGELVLVDPDLDTEPRAIYGGPEDLDALRSLSTLAPIEPTPLDAPRYRIHHCTGRN